MELNDGGFEAIDAMLDAIGMHYYGMDGQWISFREWRDLLLVPDRRRVGFDVIEGVEVSTTLLGVDHNFGLGGPPLIFETMVFGLDVYDDCAWRYPTRELAEHGHELRCEEVRQLVKHARRWRKPPATQ